MLEIVRMSAKLIDEVYKIETESFSVPWTKGMFKDELKNNVAYYFVALADGHAVGYCGMWHVVNEGHITNIAVSPEFRRHGIGKALMGKLFDLADELELIGITLEVRMNNAPAQALYASLGFKPEGLRKGYYAETGEDAIIMWKYFNRPMGD